MWENRKKILVIEDCSMTNEVISWVTENKKEFEITIVSTRAEALKVLNKRDDFTLAFVDWNLEDGVSDWVIQRIKETQKNISHIFATSASAMIKEQISQWALHSINFQQT